MNNEHGQWVALPNFLALDKQGLKYLDVLVYASIRSYHNTASNECFPSNPTIAKRAGVSRDFVADSVKRLEKTGLIKVKRTKSATEKNNSNKYYFKAFSQFEMIPMSLFEDSKLDKYEKAMILCLRQFFNFGDLTSPLSIADFANNLGLSYRTVHAQLTKLISKDYLSKEWDEHFQLTEEMKWIDSMSEAMDAKWKERLKALDVKEIVRYPPIIVR